MCGKPFNKWLSSISIISVGSAILFSSSAFAQPTTSRYQIEETTITARRVEEGLQGAAIAVTALTGTELDNRGALDVIDFADVAPNVSLKTNGAVSGFAAAPRTSIRGIGQSDFVINTDPAVGMYADGVYLGRSIGSVLDLVDVERVEALRGPQGTLFGRNSTGGAINVISKKPEVGGSLNGYLTAAFGEDGYRLYRGSANIPMSDTAALRVSGLKRERDGFIPLLTPGYGDVALGAEDVTGLKAAFRFQPSDTFTLDLDVDMSERSDSAAPIIAVDFGDLSFGESGLDSVSTGTSTSLMARRFNGEFLAAMGGANMIGEPVEEFQSVDAGNAGPDAGLDDMSCGNASFRDSSDTCLGDYYISSRDGSHHAWFDNDGDLVKADDQSLETYGYSARMSWEFDNISISTISAWRGFDSSFTNGSPTPIYTATNDNVLFDQDQSSHEINLSGDISEGLSWLAGYFYQEEDGREIVQVRYPLVPPANGGTLLPLVNIENRFIDNSSRAFYAQLSADLTDSLQLTTGARRTKEEKAVDITSTTFPAGDPDITPFIDSLTANETNMLINLSWDISDDSMIYLQFADGFRNGGFPARTPAGTAASDFPDLKYGEEFVDSWELGLKSTFFDGTLRINAALFVSDYTDMQINATQYVENLGNSVGTIQNVGDSQISGFELEGSYLANDNLRFDLSLGYLDTELKSIQPDPDGVRQFVINQGNNLQKTITVNSDVELPHAPSLQINLGTNFSFYLGNDAEIRNRIDLFYEDEQYSSVANYKQGLIPSTTRINYVATYIPNDANWEATLGIRNLTDEEDILNTAIETGPRAGLYHVQGRGREAYAQFKYNFGD